jgi:hypothetical protein
MNNVNTRTYWDQRFGSGDWAEKGGFSQTRAFALSQMDYLDLPEDFYGTICDFGCGAGDAMPVYRARFPKARLLGIDFSQQAIELAQARYGELATFRCGDHGSVPFCDVIISSNVFEHLDGDRDIAVALKEKCRILYIVVPFKEKLVIGGEHVNSYDMSSFDCLGQVERKVFLSEGWSFMGLQYLREIVLKNLVRPFIGRPVLRQNRQVMYKVAGTGLAHLG